MGSTSSEKPTTPLLRICSEPLLKNVTKKNIEVSSTLDGVNTGKERLIVNTKEENGNSGGWVAGEDNENQYIMITFDEPHTITGIITQGSALQTKLLFLIHNRSNVYYYAYMSNTTQPFVSRERYDF